MSLRFIRIYTQLYNGFIEQNKFYDKIFERLNKK